jgi:3-hydroxyacyl-[acyl-carrier-protein] dehydratase
MDRIGMGPERVVTISGDHPSLAGHFPGHPVVPGVVILGEIMNAILRNAHGTIEFVGLPSAKFMSPLGPGEPLTIRWDQKGDGATEFTCTTGFRLIARGLLHHRFIADNSAGGS